MARGANTRKKEHEMFVQLAEQDRKVLEFQSSGATSSREAGSAAWVTYEGTPFKVALVHEYDKEAYLVIYGSNEAVDNNQWQLMWKDDNFSKALNYFTSYIEDLEAEEVMWMNHLTRERLASEVK